MAKRYWDYKKLNEEMRKIDEAGYQMPTRMVRIQEGRGDIIIQNDLKGAGLIRSYDEAKQFMERKYGSNLKEPYTLERYNQQIRELQDELGAERSYQGEVCEQRAQLLNILKDATTYTDSTTNKQVFDSDLYNKYKRLNTQQLYDAVKQANQMVKDSKSQSPNFYEYLIDILDGMSEAV